MKYTFSIHGVPYGSQSWGDISDSEYLKSFYNSVSASNVPTQMIVDMYHGMILPGIKKGACGCVYTQLSDVEDEINGFYTYDRKVCKVDKNIMKELADRFNKEL